MKKTRQLLPEGLAEIPPGPRLVAVLDTIDPTRLSGLDCVELMRAHARQTAHDQARFMTAMVEVGLCGIGPDDELPRMECPDEFAADEIRAALAWTRRAADTQLSLAWDLTRRLPQVFAALDAGQIDVPKARVFAEWTSGLTDGQAHTICEALLPEAPALTTGQLCERVKKMAIAIDPDWARRRYEEAVRERKIVGYGNADGTANFCGYNLPADQVAAACAHVDALAKKIKQAGDHRPVDHIRADLCMGLLDGSYTGWTETDIIGHMLAAVTQAETDTTLKPVSDPGPNASDPGDTEGAESDIAAYRDGQVIEGPWPQTTPAPEPPKGPARRAGVEIRAEITTLLGLDDHPAELPGWGHVHADLARRVVRDQTDAEWRYALTDDNGRLLYEGITRVRPTGYPPRAQSPCRGGIIELHISLSDLRRLAARPARLASWAPVIADLARHADRHEADLAAGGHPDADARHTPPRGRRDDRPDHRPDRPPGRERDTNREGRSPGRSLRRRTQIRDRTCVHPGCRAPASGTDGDHTRDWADGGPTKDENLGSLCRHDHRVKHEGGWQLTQPAPGHFVWTSRLGRHYHVRPPLIIQPLPDPVPRPPPPPPCHDADRDQDGEGDHPTWWDPPAPKPAPIPVREPDPAAEIPPF